MQLLTKKDRGLKKEPDEDEGDEEPDEGATFGIVPYVCPEGLGGVCAVVGAWGNIGAVCWGMMFKFGYIGKFDKGYEAMGYIIIASSVFSIFMRIKGQKTMFGTLEDQ